MEDLATKRYANGAILQSKDSYSSDDYGDYKIYYPVLGVVVAVYPSDDPNNRSARDDDTNRGSHWEADVRVLNNGIEGSTTLTNVVIPPGGPSGVHNFSQGLPTPATQMLDGSAFVSSGAGIDANKLDGDRVLIQFIGGKYNQPVMTHYMPHPSNRHDPSTSGEFDGGLSQGTPFLYRRNGTAVTVTDEGSIFVDTNEANSKMVGRAGGATRVTEGLGGDLAISLKPTASFSLDFNSAVSSVHEPGLPQTNPPVSDVDPDDRKTAASYLCMDEDNVNLVAQHVLNILSNNADIVIQPATEGRLYLGDQTAEENLVLGQSWKTMMLDLLGQISTLMSALVDHRHSDGLGGTGPALPPEATAIQTLIDVNLKALQDNLDDQLSDFVFTSKESPVIEDGRELETGET
ncbi:MAG: hypothetical protein L3J47_00425 [Sulfurovum sp.]|nr:hypothetical protein [Sulfurovum sp.]